jgi:hypothetical protein
MENLGPANSRAIIMSLGRPHLDQTLVAPTPRIGIEDDNVDDPKESSSTLSNPPDILDLERSRALVNVPQPTQTAKEQEALLKSDIINTILYLPLKRRNRNMPDCFDKRGKLRNQYSIYKDDIRLAREARDAREKTAGEEQRSGAKTIPEILRPEDADAPDEGHDQQRETLFLLSNENIRDRAHEEPRAVFLLSNENSRDRAHEEPRVAEALAVVRYTQRELSRDADYITCEKCQAKGQLCQLSFGSDVRPSCCSCINSGERCSLSTGGKLRQPKADIQPVSKVQPESQSLSKPESRPSSGLQSRTPSQADSQKEKITNKAASQRAFKPRNRPHASKLQI